MTQNSSKRSNFLFIIYSNNNNNTALSRYSMRTDYNSH